MDQGSGHYLLTNFPRIPPPSSIAAIVGLPDLLPPILLPCEAGWDSNGICGLRRCYAPGMVVQPRTRRRIGPHSRVAMVDHQVSSGTHREGATVGAELLPYRINWSCLVVCQGALSGSLPKAYGDSVCQNLYQRLSLVETPVLPSNFN